MYGKSDAVKLGIIEFWPKGPETVRKLSVTYKETIPEAGHVISHGLTQLQIEKNMKSIVEDFGGLFVGLGRAIGVEPMHIEVDESIKPIQ